MPTQVLNSKAEFEKAVNGPHAVVLDLSDKNCPYRFVESTFDKLANYHHVTGYRIDPKVAGIPAMVNTGTFQVYYQGKMIRQAYVREIMSVSYLEQLFKLADSKK